MQTYPQPPYYEGRFSNGPTWIEVAARQLSVGLANYAAGGATTGVVIPSEANTKRTPLLCLIGTGFLFASVCVAVLVAPLRKERGCYMPWQSLHRSSLRP